jgi:hypothetical protein
MLLVLSRANYLRQQWRRRPGWQWRKKSNRHTYKVSTDGVWVVLRRNCSHRQDKGVDFFSFTLSIFSRLPSSLIACWASKSFLFIQHNVTVSSLLLLLNLYGHS